METFIPKYEFLNHSGSKGKMLYSSQNVCHSASNGHIVYVYIQFDV